MRSLGTLNGRKEAGREAEKNVDVNKTHFNEKGRKSSEMVLVPYHRVLVATHAVLSTYLPTHKVNMHVVSIPLFKYHTIF